MIAALIGVAVVGHRLSPLLLPKTDLAGIAEANCDLNLRPCFADLPGGGRLEFSISPRPVSFLTPLILEAGLVGLSARNVEVDLAGATMNMGFNRAPLAASGPGHFIGESALPVCVTGKMTWIATVIVETERQRIAIPYQFNVGH